jgi:hypothetical protein
MWSRSFLLALLLSGCATPSLWNKPGATDATLQRDVAQCRYEISLAQAGGGSSTTRRGAAAAAGQGVAEGMASVWQRDDLTEQCLEARGWTREVKR